VSEGEQPSSAIGVRALLLAVVPVAVAVAMLGSSRTLVSWHGFVHAGIAEHLAAGRLPPENPFFAGESLPCTWVHPALAAALARVLAIDALHALALLTLASLALLMFSALRLGARHFGSAGAGLLIAWLALAGSNPAGPAIAVTKAVWQGIPLFEFAPEPVETVFVSNESADLFMTHPLLGALYVSADWRRGQNLVWFLDNSSRGPALALLLPLLALFLARRSRRVLVASAALGALTAALSPLIGLAGAGALFGGACLTYASSGLGKFAPVFQIAPARRDCGVALPVAAAALVGGLLAAPTYWQLFAEAGSEPAVLSSGAAFAGKAASMAAGFIVLAPLSCYGVWRAPERIRAKLAAIALGGLALAAAVPLIGLAGGNEHHLADAAGVLLAVPALGFAAQRGLSRLAAAALLAAFLPVTLCTLASFAGRPSLPIATDGGVLVRTPAQDPLAELYAWIRRETPRDAVFVVDAAHPVKMATNVSELPAFTGRALYVDQPSTLTTPCAGFGERTLRAAALTAGEPLAQSDRAALAQLARPVYLLSHAGDDEHLAARLTSHYGPPRFAAGFVAVYALAGERRVAPTRRAWLRVASALGAEGLSSRPRESRSLR
jgi:hypothetical protein